MQDIKRLARRFAWYTEARQFYLQVLRAGNVRKYAAYAYYRFFVRRMVWRSVRPIDRAPADDAYSIHLLCSHQDIDMLLWAVASWCRAVPETGQIYVHEDGSFTAADRALLARVAPHVRVIDLDGASRQAHDAWLADFPEARKKRDAYRDYVFIIKLIDPYFVSPAPARLILDTDILWFAEPEELLARIRDDRQTPFMQQGERHVVKSAADEQGRVEAFRFTDGTSVEPALFALNSGIVGYHTSEFSLRDLETFCARIDIAAPFHFYEQVGYAWILSQHAEIRPLSAEAYLIRGSVREGVVARHYTGPRRDQFSSEGIRLLARCILKPGTTSP